MARITKPLTFTEIERAKPKEAQYSLADGQGLYLRINPTGSKKWLFNYCRPETGKRNNLIIGEYPQTSLQQARAIRTEFLELIAQSIDPQVHREQQAIEKQQETEKTFLSIAEKWKAKKAQEVELKTLEKNWRRMELYLFPTLGALPVQNILPRLVIATLEPIHQRKIGDTLKRVIRLLNEVLNFAVNYGVLELNPCLKIADAFHFAPAENNPAISPQELPQLLADVMQSPRVIHTKLLFLFQLLTMTRPAEASGAEWAEIDLEKRLWTIPATRMKMRNAHKVPLSRQAVAVLRKMQQITGAGQYVFSLHDPNKPMHSQGINKALIDLGYKNKQTAHGLRIIGRTYLAQQRVDYEVAEMCLAHKAGSSTGRIYDRADFLEQRIEVMQLWGDYVERCGRISAIPI